MGHGFHGYVNHNQMVIYLTNKECKKKRKLLLRSLYHLVVTMEKYLAKWENQWLMIIIPSSSQLTQEDRKSHSFSHEKRDFSGLFLCPAPSTLRSPARCGNACGTRILLRCLRNFGSSLYYYYY